MKKFFFVMMISILFCAAAVAQQAGSVINISQSVTAISYPVKGGKVSVGFSNTSLLPGASGKADVQCKDGACQIQAQFKNMQPAAQIGSVYLTYVLWAITPEGRSNNLGEIELNGSSGKVQLTTRLVSFAMIVTAEPYFAVTFPSEMVVLQNTVLPGTKGTFQQVQPQFELFLRGDYKSLNLQPLPSNPKAPLVLLEAQNALRIAQAEGAPQYAADSWTKAQNSYNYAQGLFDRKKDKKQVVSSARDAVQTAEDARLIAVRKEQQDKIASEKAAAAAREAQAQAEAAASAQQAQEAQAQKMQAELAAAEAAKAQAQAESQKMAAQMQEQQAQAAAEAAQQKAEKAEEEKEALRQQILQQLNSVLATVDTPNGLVATMADVLFESGQYALRSAAKLALAKLSGIILSHPGLNLQINGYTDNVGSDSFNMTLSQQRADAVRTFLITQGLSPGTITAQGMGKADPVASNDSAVGRQQNRRVEIIVSGDVIGVDIGGTQPQQ